MVGRSRQGHPIGPGLCRPGGGLLEVPTRAFVIFNLIGTVVWVTALSLIGYALGSDYTKVEKSISHASYALIVVLLAALVAHKLHQLRKERHADAAAAASGAGVDEVPAHQARHRAPTDRRGR